MSSMFATKTNDQSTTQSHATVTSVLSFVPDYTVSPSGPVDHAIAFGIGFGAGFAILFIFYQILLLSLFGGMAFGTVNIFLAAKGTIDKRKFRLRTQFFDMLESMSVSMRAGNPPLKALESARKDLTLMYSETSDIIIELDLLVRRFNNAVPLSEIFSDLARRSKLEDISSFASVYATIEGKSSRADEIVRETQQIIADKMEIEMEIETMMTAAKGEVNMMLMMPLIVLGVIGFAGSGFMDTLYTTPIGRAVSTGGLVSFIGCYFLAKKFSNIQL